MSNNDTSVACLPTSFEGKTSSGQQSRNSDGFPSCSVTTLSNCLQSRNGSQLTGTSPLPGGQRPTEILRILYEKLPAQLAHSYRTGVPQSFAGIGNSAEFNLRCLQELYL